MGQIPGQVSGNDHVKALIFKLQCLGIHSFKFNIPALFSDKLLDEIESYWSTRTEGYSEVNEKELKGMQKKAWLETLERGFFGKRSGKNEDSENNSVEKEVFEEEFSEKQHTDKYKDHLRILDIGTGPGFFQFQILRIKLQC